MEHAALLLLHGSSAISSPHDTRGVREGAHKRGVARVHLIATRQLNAWPSQGAGPSRVPGKAGVPHSPQWDTADTSDKCPLLLALDLM